MSLGLIKPGASVALRHPKTGKLIEPIGYIGGKAVWPVLGASPDDEDDPNFTGDPDDSDDDAENDDEDDEDEDLKPRKKSTSRKRRKSDEDEDDEDEDEDDDEGPPRAVRQAKKYRLALREAEKKNAEMEARIKAIEDKDKPTDEVVSRDLAEANGRIDDLTEVNRIMSAQLAFFKTTVPGVQWVDSSDAFALAEREGLFDDVIDEDGTVDTRELRRGLRDLAKRKPHLVVKPKVEPKDDDEDDNEEEEERPRRSARTANSRRRGSSNTTNRAALEKKFPVLRGR
jgi:hypothetical protein